MCQIICPATSIVGILFGELVAALLEPCNCLALLELFNMKSKRGVRTNLDEPSLDSLLHSFQLAHCLYTRVHKLETTCVIWECPSLCTTIVHKQLVHSKLFLMCSPCKVRGWFQDYPHLSKKFGLFYYFCLLSRPCTCPLVRCLLAHSSPVHPSHIHWCRHN